MTPQATKQNLIKERLTKIIRNQKVAHAYLFEGKKGSGKKDAALFFAQALFCVHQGQPPCKECIECTRVANRNHPDIHWVEPEGQSIKIDQVRMLQKEFSYRGVEDQKKIYIVEHAEKMTPQAANSLLKFLEEPYTGTLAILLTEQKQRLLPTILSRCQEIKFPPPSPEHLSQKLRDDFGPNLAKLTSHITADLEEALSLCEANWFADLRSLVIQLIEDIYKDHTQPLFMIQDKWLTVAKEKDQTEVGLEMMLLWYRDLLYSKINLEGLKVFIDQVERIEAQAQYLTKERIAKGIQSILEAKKRLQANVNPQLLLEQLVIRLKEG